MTDILFTANGASATVLVSGELTSGMVGVPVRFAFDSDWDGLNIVVVFDGSGRRISVPLLTGYQGVLPWEVIAKANTRLHIGAEGRKSDGSIVIPTVWANAGYIREGAAATDDEGNPPTPSIYDQIMAAIEAGKLQGKPGEDGVSPTVSVTEIEGGHRVTITDEAGAKSFAVMDGKDGDDSTVEIVDNLSSTATDKALSANQGRVLRDNVSTLSKEIALVDGRSVKTVNGAEPDESGNVVVEQVSEKRIVDLEEAVQGIIDEMNYKKIDITVFACPGAGTYEMGQSVAAPTITWSLNKTPASQSLNGEALGVDVRSKAYSGSITSNKTYTLNVTGQKGETDSASGSFTFYNGVYYGSMVAGSAINNAAILALTKKLQSGRSVSFRVSSNRPVYACPTRYGTPKFTIGGFEYEWDNVATFDFTNASGYAESYSVWMHTQNVSDSVTINVT